MINQKLSNASCFSCEKIFSDNTMSYLMYGNTKVTCYCGAKNTIENVNIGFIRGAEARSTPEGARSRVWWHATLVDNWFEKISEDNTDVHVGQKNAAFDRLKFVLDQDPDVIYDEEFTGLHLWTVRFAEDAEFSDGVQNDAVNDWEATEGVSSIYLNRWESPGSVSVFTPASSLRVVSHRFITRSELRSMRSLYDHESVIGAEL